MIKKLLTSKYRKELLQLNSRIKICEELRAISPQHYNNILRDHRSRIEQLQSKINDIGTFKIINYESIENSQFKKFLWLPLLLLFFVAIFYFKPATVGRVVEQNRITYKTEVNLAFSNSSTYVFDIGNNTILTSLKISGAVIGKGSIKVYLVKDGANYTIIDSSSLKEKGIPAISGYFVKDDKEKVEKEEYKNKTTINEEIINTINETEAQQETSIDTTISEKINETPANESLQITKTITNESIQNKSIKINLKYDNNENYDADNNGFEEINGVIDLTVKDSNFSWNADKEKLCTKWEVYNLIEDKATTLCYGSDECCSLINLQPSRENWDDPFYSVYGQNGVGFSNIISAQIIYANYSLETNNVYSDIIYSEWLNLSTAYNYEKIVFSDICKDTCLLDNFNESSYTILIDIENATLDLNEITYVLMPKINTSYNLAFINEIPNITITKNNNASINLSQYFLNIDEETIFTYHKQYGINILFENGILKIVPVEDYTGTIYTFVAANKSDDLAISNLFSITVKDSVNITEHMANITYNITDPSVQLKLKKYTDLQLKPVLNYNQISFTGYEIKNDVVIMYMTLDDKTIKWLTSLSTFNDVLR